MTDHATHSPVRPASEDDRSRTSTGPLLLLAAAAGPLYVGVGALEALTRRGFSLAHHDLSLLSNGGLGWVHSTLLVVTGVLVIAGALGIGRAAPDSAWGPRLLAVYGAGLVGAGLFRADPMNGFPPGAAAGRPAHVSWHGNLHFLTGAIAFLALIAACVIFSWIFGRAGHRSRARWSLFTGIVFTAAFVGIATGSSAPPVVIAFEAAVIISFAWLTWLAIVLRGDTR
ncbi:MAG: DUF998 domain-containing protein [Mycobacteriales bacterium]